MYRLTEAVRARILPVDTAFAGMPEYRDWSCENRRQRHLIELGSPRWRQSYVAMIDALASGLDARPALSQVLGEHALGAHEYAAFVSAYRVASFPVAMPIAFSGGADPCETLQIAPGPDTPADDALSQQRLDIVKANCHFVVQHRDEDLVRRRSNPPPSCPAAPATP